jgi:hypothetical protein
MYADVKNLVTTGIGNLIDPISSALGLPWRHRGSGELASQDEIRDAWNTVKGRTDLNQRGGGYYRGVTDLYLTPEAIKGLVMVRLQQNEDILRQGFPGYDSLPADAQLGLLSMAWAAGPYFYKTFPSFTRAVNSGDFATAATQSHMKGLNADRQDANYALFSKAGEVLQSGADYANLYWSGVSNITMEQAEKAAEEYAPIAAKSVGIGFLGSVGVGAAGLGAYLLAKKLMR